MRTLIQTILPSVLISLLIVKSPAYSAPVLIMPVGDSITEGYTPNPPNGTGQGTASYRKEFENLLTQDGCSFQMVGAKTTNFPQNPVVFTSKHEGWSAHRADQLRDGHESSGGIAGMMAAQDPKPDVVLLHAGSNDIRIDQSPQATANEIDDIINAILNASPQATVLVANVIPWWGSAPNPNVTADIIALGNAIEASSVIASNSNVILVNVRDGFSQSMMQADFIHPKESGEHHIADAFYDAFDQAGLCLDETAPQTFLKTPYLKPGQGVTHPCPGNGQNTVNTFGGTTTYSGCATDSGNSGFEKVRIAIRDQNTNNWYNFINQTFGPIVQNGIEVGIKDITSTSTSTTFINWDISVTLPEGDYTFFALAVDKAGNDAFTGMGLSTWPVNTSISVNTSAPDTTPPIVNFTRPEESTIESGLVTISGTVTDDSAIDRIELVIKDTTNSQWWNGLNWESTYRRVPASLIDSAGKWDYTLELPSEASFYIAAWAWDTWLNVASPPEKIIISTQNNTDTTPPSTTILAPTNGTSATGSVAVSGKAIDNLEVARVELVIRNKTSNRWWNGSSWQSAYTRVTVALTNENWSYTLALPDDANFYVSAWAWDTQGNYTPSPAFINFTTAGDSTPPIATISSPQPNTHIPASFTLAGTATDNSAVDRVELAIKNKTENLWWNGTSWSAVYSRVPASLTETNWNYTSRYPTNSTFYLGVWVWDKSGNRIASPEKRHFFTH
ncbi:hypothetical protein AB833_05755 [Chromatiales bacterium (ex Bugula neritina AB1)]|nr:hypothetical protein AB833_05755 [Chromatiales bacterium (ex Bugula neritina AB1)]